MSALPRVGPVEAPDFYNSISEKYDKSYGKNPGLLRFIEESLEVLKGSEKGVRVLDIGCGTGIPTSLSVVESGHKLTGIDISPKMIALARTNVPEGAFEFVDMLKYDPREEFDAAFAIFSLFNFTRGQMEEAMRRIDGWVRKEGWLFIGTVEAGDVPGAREELFDEEGLCAENVPAKFMGYVFGNLLYTKKGWERLLRDNGFEIVETRKEEFQGEDSDLEVHFWIKARRVGVMVRGTAE